MHLTHQRTPVAGQRSPGRVQALAWSPGCLRLAVAGRDRVVQLFDERGERRDKFSTKPGDARVRRAATLGRRDPALDASRQSRCGT
mgnify:CR=1 FL=1